MYVCLNKVVNKVQSNYYITTFRFKLFTVQNHIPREQNITSARITTNGKKIVTMFLKKAKTKRNIIHVFKLCSSCLEIIKSDAEKKIELPSISREFVQNEPQWRNPVFE